MNEAGKPKVVVIDDEKDFLTLVEGWLSPSYAVTCLSPGPGVSEVIGSIEPDLVLLDVHMPEESGFKICREFRKSPGHKDTPVLFLTGSKSDEDFLLHLETGGSRYLTKPIGRKTLLSVLAEQLEGQKRN